jgi:outer membrane protein assembly factor BamB
MDTDWWPMFHHDLSHTGYSTSAGPMTNETMWNYTTGADGVPGSPAVVNGIVYIGSDDGNLYALNATTGTLIWNYTVGPPGQSSPAVANGIVYIAAGYYYFYALNATTGTLIWKIPLGAGMFYSPAVAGGIVYVSSTADSTPPFPAMVYALNASSGARVWSYIIPYRDVVESSPAVAGGIVYVGVWGGTVYALNATTGAQVWSQTIGLPVFYSSPAVVDGLLYEGGGDYVYALNATTGALVWMYLTGGWVESSPAVAKGTVYVGSLDHDVYALKASTGAQVWNYTTGGTVGSSPAVANGTVYVGSWDDNIYALNAATGALVWKYAAGAPMAEESSPAIVNGAVYVGLLTTTLGERNVVAFGPVHDVAVTDISSSKTVVVEGQSVSVNVTVRNEGGYAETFNVRLYGSQYGYPWSPWPIYTFTSVTLAPGSTVTLTYEDGFTMGVYTLSARVYNAYVNSTYTGVTILVAPIARAHPPTPI